MLHIINAIIGGRAVRRTFQHAHIAAAWAKAHESEILAYYAAAEWV